MLCIGSRLHRAAIALVLATACGSVAAEPTTLRSEARDRGAVVPGSIIRHSPTSSGVYVGSPGFCILPDGTYLASSDDFGPKSTQDDIGIVHIYRSTDRGETWAPFSVVRGLFWASVISHRDAVYLIGTSKQYGDLVVRKSTDGGRTWTTASDAKHGLIRPGQWHTAPVQVIEHAGRLWRSVEYAQGSGWGERFRPSVMSIPVDGDLLDAAQWTVADPMPRDGGWLGGTFKVMLEGNVVVAPDGRILDILRTDNRDLASVAVVSPDGKSLRVDPNFDRIPLPGTDKKFQIRWDERAKCYWAVCNPLPPDFNGNDSGGTRNVLALLRSTDLKTWETRCILLYHPRQDTHAFQYPDFQFDGDDLLVLSRTAYDDEEGPRTQRGHDANFLTFHRFRRFRELTPADGVAMNSGVAIEEPQQFTVGDTSVSGRPMELGVLANGEKAFSNRDYVWQNVPAKLQGMRFTRLNGGVSTPITVTVNKPTTILVATAEPTSIDLSGFQLQRDLSFRYSDRNRTAVAVFARDLKAQEKIALPVGNWSGCMVLMTP